jgi:predicted ArsR family transcriptional regulator
MNISPEPRKLARLEDPHTSKMAALRVDEFANNLCSRIYQELKKGNGTYEQLANRLGLRPDQLCRRLPDLQKAGYAEPTENTTTGKAGRSQRVWRAVIAEPKETIVKNSRVFFAPEGHRRLTINVTHEMHKKLRLLAVEKDTTITDILTNLVEEKFH